MPEMPAPKLAILHDKNAKLSPSNSIAISQFVIAANMYGYETEIITKIDAYRLHEFEILFIRDTTSFFNYTYDMSRIAHNLGLVVIDDHKSIEICCDKAIQYTLFKKNGIPVPKTLIITKKNYLLSVSDLGRPLIVKNPHGCFSNGVFKVDAPCEFKKFAEAMLYKVNKIVAQEFIKTDFDWRITIMDRTPLFACKYYMTPGHWKIIKHNVQGDYVDGDSTAIPINEVPANVLDIALKAANLIGDGLYGVDLKEVDGKVYVIEVNDNPNIDAGNEDELLGFELYKKIIRSLDIRYRQKVPR